MKHRTGLFACFLFAFVACVAALAQRDDGVRGAQGTIRDGIPLSGSVLVAGPGALEEIGGGFVTGQPYSAEQVMEHAQTLLNGTHIDQKREMSLMYRDSEGRTRTERSMFMGLAKPNGTKGPGLRLVHIYDPVAGYSYTLDPQKHIAHRFTVPIPSESPKQVRTEGILMPVPTARPAAGKPAGEAAPMQSRQIKRESLGTKVIDGLTVDGTRMTITTPEGVLGNDRPLTRVCDHWRSEELKITILSKCSDPRSGKSVVRVRNIDRAEPDPLLFQVPPDYTIEEETGSYVVGFRNEPADSR